MLKILITIILVPVAALNLLAPLLILKKQRLVARVKFEKQDEHEFLLARNERFNNMREKLRNLGFSYLGSSLVEDSDTKTFFSLYFNAGDQCVGLLVSCENPVTESTYAEFAQLYSDGTMLSICNTEVVPVYPKMLQKIAGYYPAAREPEDLFRIFKKVSSGLRRKGKVAATDDFNGFDTIEEYMARESDELVRLKYCRSEISNDGKRSLTVKGAYLMTWRSIFPGKKIQAWVNSATAKKLLRDA